MKIVPINETEEKIISSEEFKRVLDYGKPRSGHPEGTVGNHVKDILEYIEIHYKDDKDYEKLRILALLHDIGKVDQRKMPHSEKSAEIAKKFIKDNELIQIIKLHDEPYHFWKARKKYFDKEIFIEMFKNLDWKLFIKFKYADDCARSQKTSIWFEKTCRELFEKKNS